MSEPDLATDRDWFAEDTLRRAGVSLHPAMKRRGMSQRRRQAETVARREEGLRRAADEAARRKADKERRSSVPPFWPPAADGASGRMSAQDRRRVRSALPIAACFIAGVAILVAGGNYWLEHRQPAEVFPSLAAGDLVADPELPTRAESSVLTDVPPPDGSGSLGASEPLTAGRLPDPHPNDDTMRVAKPLDAAKAPTDLAGPVPVAPVPIAPVAVTPGRVVPAESALDPGSRKQTAKISARPQRRPPATATAPSGRLSGIQLRALVPGAVTRGTNALGQEFVYRFKADGTVDASTFVSANAKSSASLIETSVPWRIVGDTLCVNFAGAPDAHASCQKVRKVGVWYEALFADGTLSAKFTLGKD